MRLAKSLMLAACALLAVVRGCGTEEPNASQEPDNVVAEPKVDQDSADVVDEPDADFTNSIGMKFKLIPAGC